MEAGASARLLPANFPVSLHSPMLGSHTQHKYHSWRYCLGRRIGMTIDSLAFIFLVGVIRIGKNFMFERDQEKAVLQALCFTGLKLF